MATPSRPNQLRMTIGIQQLIEKGVRTLRLPLDGTPEDIPYR